MPTEQRRIIQNLPPILNINCGNFSEDDLHAWRADSFFKFDSTSNDGRGNFKSFLPLFIRLLIDNSSQSLKVEEFNDVSAIETDEKSNNIYQLTSVICQVKKENELAHLISFVRMGDGNWYLFNDFLVRQVSDHEAIQFKSKWKSPAILQFSRIDINQESIINRLKSPTLMDRRAFDDIMRIGYVFRNYFSRGFDLKSQYAGYRTPSSVVMPLSFDEIESKSGYLVALDAEFVALSREETEVRTDGTRSLIRPVRLHLARVSLIRGQDFHEGICFVDDYISTSVCYGALFAHL